MENYPAILYNLDKKKVMMRMGAMKADFTGALEADIDAYIESARAFFTVSGRAQMFDIKKTSDETFLLEGHEIRSALLSRMLGGSDRIYLMGTTIPQREVDEISALLLRSEGLKAMVYDAYASEYVDEALPEMMKRKNVMLRRVGLQLTRRRFSAGYGDLDISYQKIFYDLLDMKSMGVAINDMFLMTPEKSVIAIAGVE